MSEEELRNLLAQRMQAPPFDNSRRINQHGGHFVGSTMLSGERFLVYVKKMKPNQNFPGDET